MSVQACSWSDSMSEHPKNVIIVSAYHHRVHCAQPPSSQSAAGWDYHAKLEQHESQRDHSKGFGGKYGVEKDRVDQVGLTATG